MILASFALLSVPLGLALKRIALQSQTELAVRSALEASAQRASGRVSALRVDAGSSGVAVEAVLMLPNHVAGMEAQLQRELGERLGRPVSVRLQEVLTADDASFARQQGTLLELRRSVSALQDAESMRGAQQRAREEDEIGMRSALLPHLGRLQRSEDGRRWQLWLSPELAMPLARARRIEAAVNAGRTPEQAPLEVYPVLQGLPPIALAPAPVTAPAGADDKAANAVANAPGPTAAQQQALSAQVWALHRWRAGGVAAVVATRDDARAEAWELALRQAVSERGLVLASVRRERTGEDRLQLLLAAP